LQRDRTRVVRRLAGAICDLPGFKPKRIARHTGPNTDNGLNLTGVSNRIPLQQKYDNAARSALRFAAISKFCINQAHKPRQLTFLHAERLIVGQKDILKICNHSDTHMDFGSKDAITRDAG
jgi:hypothetical protein